MIKKIAVYNGDVMAFHYQSTCCEEIEAEVDESFLLEPVFTSEQVNRFKVVDGIVIRKEEEEIKLDPQYNNYQDYQRQCTYEREMDGLQHKANRLRRRGDVEGAEAIDILVDAKEAEIKARYPKIQEVKDNAKKVSIKKSTIISKRKYGWKKSKPDTRDYKFAALNFPIKILPSMVDLREQDSPIEDQKATSSCTSHALAGALQFLEVKDKDPYVNLSRLFIYYNERMIEGDTNEDDGAQLRDGIKALQKYGVCPESEWPFDLNALTIKPTNQCYTDALAHTIVSYHALSGLNEMKTCLANGFPFVCGIQVYESFESETVSKTGIVPMPEKHEKIAGGHACACVGFIDAEQMFIVRNSWGTNWGILGYFKIPYAYLASPKLASDFWYINRANNI